MSTYYDVIIIGAGAAGLFCASIAGKRGRKVLLVDHAKKVGEKIRISGGGRCNFTNIHTSPANFLSENPRFCISALKRFSAQDFIDRVKAHGIQHHEKTLGQLFCDNKSQEIIDMLLKECGEASVDIQLNIQVSPPEKSERGYKIWLGGQAYECQSLIVACGGKSIPKMGATGFGYDIAEQFGIDIIETSPALVPFTFSDPLKSEMASLSGVSVPSTASFGKTKFDEALLFTHRGLSGPSILQISSYWQEGQAIRLNLLPSERDMGFMVAEKMDQPKLSPVNSLANYLPKRLASSIAEELSLPERNADLSKKQLSQLDNRLHRWDIIPAGTEGYRTAEVTKGGVNTKNLSSKSMESNLHTGLYFIGEVVDVTGHLGGYNFQWAWSSAYAAGSSA